MRRYKYYSANKKKIVALTVAVVLMGVLLMGAMTSWFTDFNPFCWFGHEYNEAGVCIKCDHAIVAEPNEEETPETPEEDGGAGQIPALASTMAASSDELNDRWTECDSIEDSFAGGEFNLDMSDIYGEDLTINGKYYCEFFEDTGDGDAFMILSSTDRFLNFGEHSDEWNYTLYIIDADGRWFEASFLDAEGLDSPVVINVPGVYDMIVARYSDCGDEWIYGYTAPFTVYIDCEPGVSAQEEVIISYVVDGKIVGTEVTYAGYVPGLDYTSIMETITGPDGYKITKWTYANEVVYNGEAFDVSTTLYAVLERISFPVSFVVDGDYVGQIVLFWGDTLTEDFNVVETFNLDLAEGYTVGILKFADGEEYDGQAFTKKTSLYASVEVIKLKVSLVADGEIYKELNVDYGTTVSDALKQTGNSLTFTVYDKAVLDTEIVEDMQIVGELTAAGNLIQQTWFQYLLVSVVTIAVVACVYFLRKKFGR